MADITCGGSPLGLAPGQHRQHVVRPHIQVHQILSQCLRSVYRQLQQVPPRRPEQIYAFPKPLCLVCKALQQDLYNQCSTYPSSSNGGQYSLYTRLNRKN